MRRFILLLGVVFLAACNSRSYQKHEMVVSTFEANKDNKAIVILKAKGKASFIGATPKVSFDLVRIPHGEEKEVFYRVAPGLFSQFKFWGSGRECLMIEPGFYIIDNISWQAGNTTYFTKQDRSPSLFPVKYGAFEVKPGTVNYLGDFEFLCNQSQLALNKVDNLSEVKAELEKNHPELSSQLISIEFFPGGTTPRPE